MAEEPEVNVKGFFAQLEDFILEAHGADCMSKTQLSRVNPEFDEWTLFKTEGSSKKPVGRGTADFLHQRAKEKAPELWKKFLERNPR